MQSRFRFAAVLSLLVGIHGCEGSAQQATIVKTVPASGILTFQGLPLEDYQVMFYPEGGQRPAAGKTDFQGKFTLGTNVPGDGAVYGKHRVAVNYVGPELKEEPGKEELRPPPSPKIVISEKYSNAETSGVTREVPESGTNSIEIRLE